MKQGYANRQVKDICAKGSSQVAQKDLEGLTGDYPIYGASGLIKNVDFYHQEKEYIGLIKDGSGIGRVMFLPPKSSVIGTLQYILPKEGYNIRYIGYCLQSLKLDKYKQGAAIPHIYFKDYGEAQILVADNPDEQQRIVDLLDAEFAKIDALKANAEKNLQNAKDLFQAALKKELEPKEGWEWSYLPSISENLDSKRIPITQKDRIAGVYPYYGASGIVDYVSEYLFDDDLLLISEDGANLLARSTPIAFSVSGKVWVNNHAHILKFKDMATQKIVEYYFASIFIDEYITGAAQPKLTQANMNKIAIPLPPTLTDQQSIVARLDALSEKCKALQANYEKTLSLCDDLKQALLRKAFNGEL